MKSCKECRYYRSLEPGCRIFCCHYAIDTGRARGSSVEGCTKKETARKEQSQIKNNHFTN